MDSIWVFEPEQYFSIKNESRKYILYPNILSCISGEEKKILDFGCGDGSLSKLINPVHETWIYDISRSSIVVATRNCIHAKPIYDVVDIPSDSFDYVIFSLVLTTISSSNLCVDTLKILFRALKKNGILLLGTTHPCFREEVFSSFYTDFLQSRKFNYSKECQAFKVFIKDIETGDKVSFIDFHWSLEFTLKILIETGFNIEEILELQDSNPIGGFYNKNKCPYLLVVARK